MPNGPVPVNELDGFCFMAAHRAALAEERHDEKCGAIQIAFLRWRSDGGSDRQDSVSKRSASTKVSTRGAWKPRLVFWLLAAAVIMLGVAELLNVMRRPSFSRLKGPAEANSFV